MRSKADEIQAQLDELQAQQSALLNDHDNRIVELEASLESKMRPLRHQYVSLMLDLEVAKRLQQ